MGTISTKSSGETTIASISWTVSSCSSILAWPSLCAFLAQVLRLFLNAFKKHKFISIIHALILCNWRNYEKYLAASSRTSTVTRTHSANCFSYIAFGIQTMGLFASSFHRWMAQEAICLIRSLSFFFFNFDKIRSSRILRSRKRLKNSLRSRLVSRPR